MSKQKYEQEIEEILKKNLARRLIARRFPAAARPALVRL